MTEILVPMDGEPPSEAALEYALCEFPDAEITVVHVIGIVDAADRIESLADDLETGYERAEARMEELFESVERRAAEAGVEIETETVFGAPSREIPAYAAAGFDRIVMGDHGQSGANEILLGSVAETVVRRATVPVTIVRSDGTRSPEPDRRFLVPIDGSSAAEGALEYVLEQHRPEAVTVLYVIDPADPEYGSRSGSGPSDRARPGSEEWYERAEAEAERALESAHKSAIGQDASVDVETVVETGDPADTIVERAREGGFDHVAVASRGRTGLDRLLLGSVAESVVRLSPVTVTVVRR